MKVKRISELKSAVLVITMLTFAIVAVLEGVAVGQVGVGGGGGGPISNVE